jgi:hypothetical protein
MTSFCNDPVTNKRISDTGIRLNEFTHDFLSCGSYFFDGHFNVVKMPKDTVLYHGSAVLADKLIVYPVGTRFYQQDLKHSDSYVVAQTDKEIQEIISENDDSISPSWYGNLETAKLYSGNSLDQILDYNCANKCILAYKLKKEAIFLLLNNEYNMAKLYKEDLQPPLKKNFSNMFDNFTKDYYQNFDNVKENLGNNIPQSPQVNIDGTPLKSYRILNNSPRRTSTRPDDLPVTEFLCKNTFRQRGYAGYISPEMLMSSTSYFHSEIVFCNPFQYLERDYLNDNDWQYNPTDKKTPALNALIDLMKKYKTTDVNTQSGNLYEQTVWAVLWVEELFRFVSTRKYFIDLKFSDAENTIFLKTLAVAAFLHKIGKITSQNYRPAKQDFVYSDSDTEKNDPEISYSYIQKKTIDYIKLDEVFSDIGFSMKIEDMMDYIASPIYVYKMFTKDFSTSRNDFNVLKTFITRLNSIEKLKFSSKNQKRKLYIVFISIMLGFSDMLSTIPPGIGNLSRANINLSKSKINIQSEVIPNIKNVSSIYKGSRDTIVIRTLELRLNSILEILFSPS